MADDIRVEYKSGLIPVEKDDPKTTIDFLKLMLPKLEGHQDLIRGLQSQNFAEKLYDFKFAQENNIAHLLAQIDPDLLLILLNRCTDKTRSRLLKATNAKQETPLHLLDRHILKIFQEGSEFNIFELRSYTDINAQDVHGNTLLNRIILLSKENQTELNHLGVVSKLLEGGVKPELQNLEGQCSLHLIANMGWNNAAMQVLKENLKCASLPDKKDRIPLLLAIMQQPVNQDLVNILCKSSPLEKTDLNGDTGLHYCVMHNPYLVSSFLNLSGIDINVTNTAGNTPLHLAMMSSNQVAIQALEEKGADKTLVNNAGQTPEDVKPKRKMRERVDSDSKAATKDSSDAVKKKKGSGFLAGSLTDSFKELAGHFKRTLSGSKKSAASSPASSPREKTHDKEEIVPSSKPPLTRAISTGGINKALLRGRAASEPNTGSSITTSSISATPVSQDVLAPVTPAPAPAVSSPPPTPGARKHWTVDTSHILMSGIKRPAQNPGAAKPQDNKDQGDSAVPDKTM